MLGLGHEKRLRVSGGVFSGPSFESLRMTFESLRMTLVAAADCGCGRRALARGGVGWGGG